MDTMAHAAPKTVAQIQWDMTLTSHIQALAYGHVAPGMVALAELTETQPFVAYCWYWMHNEVDFDGHDQVAKGVMPESWKTRDEYTYNDQANLGQLLNSTYNMRSPYYPMAIPFAALWALRCTGYIRDDIPHLDDQLREYRDKVESKSPDVFWFLPPLPGDVTEEDED